MPVTGGKDLTPLKEFKKQMLEYAKTTVDLEEGETPRTWVNTYIKALEEDGHIVTIGGIKYVLD